MPFSVVPVEELTLGDLLEVQQLLEPDYQFQLRTNENQVLNVNVIGPKRPPSPAMQRAMDELARAMLDEFQTLII